MSDGDDGVAQKVGYPKIAGSRDRGSRIADRGLEIADRGFRDRGSRRDRGKNSDTKGFFLGICGVRRNVVFCVQVIKKS